MGRSTMCTLLAAVLFIMAIQVAKTSAEPRVFNLRSGEQDDRDQFSVFTPTDVVKQYGSSATSDYFRLLELDGDYLIIGAADSVHNISVETFQNVSIYRWAPGELEREDCIMKSVEQACRNYIRVLNRRDDGDLLICGTNAYKPMCRVVDKHTHKAVIEFSGTGLSPLDPKHNTTFYMDQDYLYAATVADFAGTDSLIFRRNISVGEDRGLRTQRNNAMLLNKPQFVGTLHSDEVIGVMWTLATGTSSTSSKRRTRFKVIVPGGLDNEMKSYESFSSSYDDPLEFWKINERNFPNLAIIAKMCFGVMGSNTPSERAFKELRVIFGNCARTRLHPLTTATLIHLRQLYKQKIAQYFAK